MPQTLLAASNSSCSSTLTSSVSIFHELKAEVLDLPPKSNINTATERITSLTQEGVGSSISKQPQSATTSEPPEVEQSTKVVDVLTKPSSPPAEVERITTAVKMLKKEEVACTAEWRQALLKKNKLVQAQKDVPPQQRVDEAETANTKAKKVFQQSKHELKQLEKRFASCKFILLYTTSLSSRTIISSISLTLYLCSYILSFNRSCSISAAVSVEGYTRERHTYSI